LNNLNQCMKQIGIEPPPAYNAVEKTLKAFCERIK